MKIVALLGFALNVGCVMAQALFDLDTTFRSTVERRTVNSILPLPDGDVVISGIMRFPGDANDRTGARLNSDGTQDLSFANETYMGGKLMPWNGRIYAGNGNIVRRLWPNGTLDTDFILMNADPYFSSGQGGDYHVYPDGRILMTGLHLLSDTIHGYEGFYSMVWFSNTGYLDTTAHHRTSDNSIFALEEQPDGRFLCSGWISQYEGQPVGHVFRVLPDGALDPSFTTDFIWGEANAITVLADQRIILSGYMIRDGMTDTLRVVRLLPDGSLDPTFNNALSAPREQFGNHSNLKHTVLEDGRIVLHGGFYQVDGEPRSGIAMLNPDGELIDDAFTPGGCGNYYDELNSINVHSTWGMAQGPEGDWYIHGGYHGYDDGTKNDTLQRFVSRLYGLDVGVKEPAAETGSGLRLYPNPASSWVVLAYDLDESAMGGPLVIRDLMGREVHRATLKGAMGQVLWDTRQVPAGSYSVVLQGALQGPLTQKLIIQP
ncbi:MAG: hypothetical protein IPL77_01395 [Flavobacteriales bacterium]|nr:hypothetical protein [Flavobacteriales bacterium]